MRIPVTVTGVLCNRSLVRAKRNDSFASFSFLICYIQPFPIHERASNTDVVNKMTGWLLTIKRRSTGRESTHATKCQCCRWITVRGRRWVSETLKITMYDM